MYGNRGTTHSYVPGTRPTCPMSGNEISNLGAAKKSIHNSLGVGGAVLRDPTEDVFEIGERPIVENKLIPSATDPAARCARAHQREIPACGRDRPSGAAPPPPAHRSIACRAYV